jgi:hypothetical protein
MSVRTVSLRTGAITDWPLYWFAQLERANEKGDRQSVSEANRNLKRLGVRVSFARRKEATHVR